MKTQSAKSTKALCLALSALNLFVSGREGHAAEPPLNPWLWVLHDEDPDWTNPPFEDSLTVLDTGGTALLSVADFNVAQTLGGNRVVSVFPNQDAAVVCDFVARRMSKVDRQGQRVFSVEREIRAADVAPDGRVFASGGPDPGLFRVSAAGQIEKEVPMGWREVDLVVDPDRSRVCVVGADVGCFDEDLNLLWSVDPISWYGVAVDFASEGSLWVAERDGTQARDRLLRISLTGALTDTIPLPFSPFCVRVDRRDDSVYVVGAELRKYDRTGQLLFSTALGDPDVRGWSLAIDPSGDVWVGTWTEVQRYSPEGKLVLSTQRFVRPSDTWVAMRALPATHGATDGLWVEFGPNRSSARESAGVVNLEVRRRGTVTGPFTVDYTVEGGSASFADFQASNGTLAFAEGEMAKTIAVTIVDDAEPEAAEGFSLTLRDPTGGAELGPLRHLALWILDNDVGVRISSAPREVEETSGGASFSVNRVGGADIAFSVDYATLDGTAKAAADYEATSGTLHFAAGESYKSVFVRIFNDGFRESRETFQLQLSSPTAGAQLATPSVVSVAIVDNDPGVYFADGSTSSPVDVGESAGTVSLRVWREGDDLSPGTVDFATTDGTAKAGLDYTATSGTLRFGGLDFEKFITVPILNDGLRETRETFRVTLSNPTGSASLGVPSSVTVGILDNDPGVFFAQGSYSVSEAAGTVSLTVLRQSDDLGVGTVDFATSDGSATAGLDYAASAGTVTFAAGETNKTIVAPILNDSTPEARESFRVTLSNPTGSASLGQRITTTVNVDDNDGGIRFALSSVSVLESAGAANLTVLRHGDDLGVGTVDYTFRDGTATAGQDYEAVAGTLVFAAGETEKTLVVPIVNDGLTKSQESFEVTLANPTGSVGLGQPATVTVRLNDNDPGVMVETNRLSVEERTGAVLIAVVRRSDDRRAFSVDYATSDATAEAGSDYTVTTGTLQFAEGEERKTIQVPILADGVAESRETFTLSLSNAVGGPSVGPTSTATITILDNDAGVQFTVDEIVVSEAAGEVSFTIERDRAGGTGAFEVQLGAQEETARSGSDFTGWWGTLGWSPGQLVWQATWQIVKDTLREGEETFRLTLSNPTGGVVLGPRTNLLVRIQDSDPGLRFDAPGQTVSETVGTATLTVLRGHDNEMLLNVEYATKDDTARAGTDYVATSGKLEFLPGETSKTIFVPILSDGLVSPVAKRFLVELRNPSLPGALGAPAETRVGIGVDYTGVVFAPTDYRVGEGEGQVALTILRGNDVDLSPFTIDYVVTGDTATAGSDYDLANGTATFAAGEMAKTITVKILQDTLWEGDETISLKLTHRVGTVPVGSDENTTARVSILDDDLVGWEQVYPDLPLLGVTDIAHGAGRFVVVTSDQRKVATSTNGLDWLIQDLIIEEVGFGNGHFVGIGENRTLLTSPDGQTWTPQAVRAPEGAWHMAAGNGLIAGIDSGGNLWVSRGGAQWTVDRSTFGGNVSDLVFGGGQFLAVGDGGGLFTSENGSDWIAASLPADATVQWVAYGAGQFVGLENQDGLGNVSILTSPDGNQWTKVNVPLIGVTVYEFRPLIPFGAGFVSPGHACSDNRCGTGLLHLQRQGDQWRADFSWSPGQFFKGAAGDGVLLAVTEGGQVFRSADARHWVPLAAGAILDLLSTDEGFFAAGSRGLLRSPDGADWTLVSAFGQGATSSRTLTYGEGTLVNAGATCGWGCNFTLEISTNATDWVATQPPYPGFGNQAALAYGSGVFAGIGKGSDDSQGRDLHTSADGLDWSPRARLPQAEFVRDVAYGNGQFVAVGSVIVTSPDGFHWTLDPLPAPADTAGGYWTRVAFGAGQFAVLSEQGWLFTSPDAVNWTLRGQVGHDVNAYGSRDFAVGPGIFAAATFSGVFLSPDGANWRWHSLPGGQAANAVTFANGRVYVGAGSTGWGSPPTGGAIFRSSPIVHLSPPRFIAPDSWGFTLSGEPGETYVIETSSDLVVWESLGQLTLVGATGEIVDLNAARASHRYYRARGIHP